MIDAVMQWCSDAVMRSSSETLTDTNWVSQEMKDQLNRVLPLIVIYYLRLKEWPITQISIEIHRSYET